MFSPHLLWQIENAWPTLEFQANARDFKNMPLSIGGFAGQQVLMGNPVVLPLWVAGGGALLASKRLAGFRSLGFVYPTLFFVFALTNGKSYYLAPAFPLLYAAGAVVAEPLLVRAAWRAPALIGVIVLLALPAVPIGLPVLEPRALVEWQRTIGMAAPALEVGDQPQLPQTFADMHGWEELVDAVERVVRDLPANERASAVVFATNYGEAGAIDVLGKERNLPPVICGHNSYWSWRPASIGTTVIALRLSKAELERWFRSVERVDTITCEWCMPAQNNSAVHVARGWIVEPEQFWGEIRRYQ